MNHEAFKMTGAKTHSGFRIEVIHIYGSLNHLLEYCYVSYIPWFQASLILHSSLIIISVALRLSNT